MPPFQDLYVRDALDDTGSAPYSGRVNSMSPDILPRREGQQRDFFKRTWGESPEQGLVQGMDTYVYVRGKNLGTQPTSGRVHLYAVPSSLLLDVSRWSSDAEMSTGIAGGNHVVGVDDGELLVPANEIFVVRSPFLVNLPMSSDFHYCFLARVVTDQHPNPVPPPFKDTGAFVRWVTENPNVAWKNTTVVPNETGAMRHRAYFKSLESVPRQYFFTVTASGFPVKSRVTIECLTSGGIFSSVSFFGPPSKAEKKQFAFTPQVLPAMFQGVLNVTVEPPEHEVIPPGVQLEVSYSLHVTGQQADTLARFALPADQIGFDPRLIVDRLGRDDMPRLVRLGQCSLHVSA